MVSYCFPPMGGLGPQRVLRFVRYLPRFGWEPVVLTEKNGYYPRTGEDREVLKFIPPELRVVRVSGNNLRVKAYKFLTELLQKKRGGKALTRGEIDKYRRKSLLFELVWRLKREVLFFPDFFQGWIKPAVKAGKKILKNDAKIRLLYSCAIPWSSLVVGGKLKERTSLPLVLDLRDPWTTEPTYGLNTKKHKKLERYLFRLADRIILATENMKGMYSEVYPMEITDKMLVIRNGFDPAIIDSIEPVTFSSNKLNIVYTGWLSDDIPPSATQRSSYYLLHALNQLKREKPERVRKLTIRFVGWIGPNTKELVEELGIKEQVEFHPPTSLIKSIGYQKGADILLLIIKPGKAAKHVLTGKIFEYIGVKRPILALAPDSEAAELIKSEGIGIVVPPDNPELIKEALLHYLDEWEAGRLPQEIVAPHREDFSAENLTKKLAEVFNELG